jgi:sulfate transport system permease protein
MALLTLVLKTAMEWRQERREAEPDEVHMG